MWHFLLLFWLLLLSREGHDVYFQLENDMLLTLLTINTHHSLYFPFSEEKLLQFLLFWMQFMLWCFVGVAMSARMSFSWMALLCWQNLWQQFWQPTTFVALVCIVWGEVVANAATRKDHSVLLSRAGRCLWCSHSGNDPTKPGGDGVCTFLTGVACFWKF